MNRRRFLQVGAAAVAATAIGGGVAFQLARQRSQRVSARIVGPWEELQPGAVWLLPNLDAAPMLVPDRPHTHEEANDPIARAKIRRTRAFSVTTGSQRLRGGDPGPVSGRRVICIGDSVTFGWGVEVEASWPSQLGKLLGVDVVNAGVPAQRLETMAAWVEREGRKLGASTIVLVRRPYPDTPDPIGAYRAVVERMRRVVPDVKVFLSPISRFDVHGQEVGDTEAAQLQDVGAVDLTGPLRAAQGDRGWRVRADGAELVLERMDGSGAVRAPRPQHDLPQAFYDRLEADADVREALFFDDGHPDADGLKVMAETIAGRV